MKRGACFSCSLEHEEGTDFNRFQTVSNELVYNPWSQLGDLNQRAYSWSQPSILAWYIPFTRPRELLDSFPESLVPRLRFWTALAHERYVHLGLLNATPGKRWMQFLLKRAYTHLADLLRVPDSDAEFWREIMKDIRPWPEDKPGVGGEPKEEVRVREANQLVLDISAWADLKRMNTMIWQTAEAIRMAEELLACSLSFATVKGQISEQPDVNERNSALQELEHLETECVAHYENEMPGFAELYPRFQKLDLVLQRLRSTESELYMVKAFFLLGSFLEPAHESVHELKIGALESRERCERLASCVDAVTDGREVIQWLEGEVQRLGGWKGDDQELTVDRPFYVFPSYALQSKYWLYWQGVNSRLGRGVQTILYPTEVNGRWYITPLITGDQHELVEDAEEYLDVLALEAIRQQIDDEVRMIRCPMLSFQPGDKCVCEASPEWKEKLLNLVHWAGAMNGSMQKGLPFPCGNAG